MNENNNNIYINNNNNDTNRNIYPNLDTTGNQTMN